MAYDIVRWGVGIVLFVAIALILNHITKNKGKSLLVASFAAIISVAVLLLVPVENYIFGFSSVEKIYSYRHHEKLLTYAECDEGVLCVGKKDEMNYVYYTFDKVDGKYKLPSIGSEDSFFRSSKFGIYTFKRFANQVIIITQVPNSTYDGKKFEECELGYYTYTVIDGDFNYSLLYCSGEMVKLVQ